MKHEIREKLRCKPNGREGHGPDFYHCSASWQNPFYYYYVKKLNVKVCSFK